VTVEDLLGVEELLRAGGGRSTPVRRTVIKALLDADDHHVTAPELLAAIRRDDPSFQESSLYRTLERLTELGVVRQLHLGPGSAVYHLSAHSHHHLVCDRCGAVEHVAPAVLTALRRRLERDHGFILDTDHVTLTGTCRRCST
jgi:Fur family ferric uptake transcriptional regulator